MLALLQDRDGQTGLRQFGCHDGTTGTGADNHDVELRIGGEFAGRPDLAGRAGRSRTGPQRRTRLQQPLVIDDLLGPLVASPLTHRADPRIGFVTDASPHLRLLVVGEDDKVASQQHHSP